MHKEYIDDNAVSVSCVSVQLVPRYCFYRYLDNQEWMDHVTSGEYQKYYDNMYKDR